MNIATDLYDQTLGAGQDVAIDEPHKLTSSDRDSVVWLKMQRYLEESLQELRISNDEHHSELETAAIRGSIRKTKEFLALGQPRAKSDPDGPDLGY